MAQPTYLQPTNTGNVNCYNTTNSYNNIVNHNRVLSDEDARIMQWLSPLEPQNIHRSVRTDRLDGVGDWLLETGEFREWKNSTERDQAVLLCYGNPGVGKTYLNSLVIDSLCDNAGGGDIAVAMLYCDFLAQQEQSTTNMLGAILKQLVGREEIPDHVRLAFREGKRFSERGLRLADLMRMLKTAIASLPQVFICIDALDEFAQKNRLDLLESLRDIIRESPATRVFITGRPHIREGVGRYLSKVVAIPVSPNQGDIIRYLEMKLDRDADPNAMDDGLRADIMKIIPEKISEIFLLVSLKIDAILAEVTIYQRQKKLYEITQGDGLRDAYKSTLARIKAQKGSKSRLGMEVLMWVSHSERPLEANELCHALGVERGSTDLNVENIPAIQTLLGCSLGLVTVEETSWRVRLIHFTLQEYLSQDPTLFQSPHSTMAEVCLTYLNFQHVKDIPPAFHPDLSTAPLVRYASIHWGSHARREVTEGVKLLALELLDAYDKHVCSSILLHNDEWLFWNYGLNHRSLGFTGLHGAAFLGIVEVFVALLELKEWAFNAQDSEGNTAIAWATKKGHEGIVKILLGQEDVIPDTANYDGQTPLLIASMRGYEGIMKTLLEREDVNPNAVDSYGKTPLSWAAEMGNEWIVKALLAREGVNPDGVGGCGRTPLSWAAEMGNGGIVRTLIELGGANPDTVDNRGLTPLSWASMRGHEETIKVLLERGDVRPNATDCNGQTPLLWAASNGREGVVKTLLEQEGVNPNVVGNYGRTPLLWASMRGHEGTIKILLEREDVSPSTKDFDSLTPLLWAARNGHEEIVKILLGREGVSSDAMDDYGRTPLSWAAEMGNGRIVRTLIELGGANPDTVDNRGLTPLSWASMRGHEETIKVLLERGDVKPNATDRNGQTPLSWAAENGHGGAVKVLLEREDVNPNIADNYGRTPLLWATMRGHERALNVLLEEGNASPDTADNNGQTPLSWASNNGHERLVNLLGNKDFTHDSIFRENPTARLRTRWGFVGSTQAPSLAGPGPLIWVGMSAFFSQRRDLSVLDGHVDVGIV